MTLYVPRLSQLGQWCSITCLLKAPVSEIDSFMNREESGATKAEQKAATAVGGDLAVLKKQYDTKSLTI